MFIELMKIHITIDHKNFIPRVLEKIFIRNFISEFVMMKNIEFRTKPLNPSTSCKQ